VTRRLGARELIETVLDEGSFESWDTTPVPVAEPVGASARAATPRERLSGTLQYVFGSGDPGFSVDETFGGAVEADAPPARRAGASASGVETHHLA